MDEKVEYYGTAIRQARKTQGKTLKDVSEAAGHSIPHISDIETGKSEGSASAVAAVARAVGLRLLLVKVVSGGMAEEATAIPLAGNQTIGEMAQRLCSRLKSPLSTWAEGDEAWVREVLSAVFLAGYEQGKIAQEEAGGGCAHSG